METFVPTKEEVRLMKGLLIFIPFFKEGTFIFTRNSEDPEIFFFKNSGTIFSNFTISLELKTL